MTFGANISELKNKAEQGNAEAQYNLGICYDNGYGIEKNIEEAVKWYRKAVSKAMPKRNIILPFVTTANTELKKM